ncbi:hypothetical protein LZQ00_05910 [Sphingobacterium sp. SRCM116780]|uniref:hypothetical protein n=1 Tax=Sphingobacterium sp. SRCM116780 TaxID=2907623 RepID=UPI001F376B62|nr:hypothetical protein [Sphingobacterium sp. SRCM116780]UIR57350.1 hypothetical protein LZQ00_05910 [Sphingobacterium sp. SRCM116780]
MSLKILVCIVLCMFIRYESVAQEKLVMGDIASYNRFTASLIRQLGLEEQNNDQNTTIFRYWNSNQVLQIVERNGEKTGSLTNYILRHQYKNQDEHFLFNQINLSESDLVFIDSLLQHDRLDTLPSEEDIKGWPQGFDGIAYQLEFRNASKLKVASYWMPQLSQLPEARQLMDFIHKLENFLHFDTNFSTFRKSLLQKGCYSFGSGWMMCFISNPWSIDYSATTSNPIGYSISKGFPLCNRKRYLTFNMHHRFTKDYGEYDFLVEVIPSKLIFTKQSFDFMSLSYRKRKIVLQEEIEQFQNLQILYGLHYKKMNFGAGIDYLTTQNKTSIAPRFLGIFSGWTFLNLEGKASIFANRVDYELGIKKSFSIQNDYLQEIHTKLFMEHFQQQMQYGIQVGVALNP